MATGRGIGHRGSMVRKALDQLFWRQYADELHSNPESPVACCILGMSHVWVIALVTSIGLLAPIFYSLRRIVYLEGGASGIGIDAGLLWFIVLALIAMSMATWLTFGLYWRYRLVPEKALALYERDDRDRTTAIAMIYLGVALGFMALMIVLFR
jgi:hypothetical protein